MARALGEALRMLESFASVGVKAFDITHINIDAEKRGFRPRQSLEQTRQSMPFLIASAERRQNNVIVRPHNPPAVFLIQLDDLTLEKAERVRAASFLTLETSPGNYQAWTAMRNETGAIGNEYARRVRKGTGADPTASGATRVAGTANFKRKYEPDFPTVRISAVEPGRIVTPADLESLGLVAAPALENRAASSLTHVSKRSRGRWPNYRFCLDRAPIAQGSDRPDISRADYTWCLTAYDWGWSVEAIAARLMEESSKAQENGQHYALLTARNAAAAVERRKGLEHGL